MRRLLLVLSLLSAAACSSSQGASNDTQDALAPTEPDGGAVTAETCAPDVPVLPAVANPACAAQLPAQRDAFDDALAASGLDRCTIGYSARDKSTYGSPTDPFRLPWFDAVHDAPMRVPGFGRAITHALDDAAGSQTPVAGALQTAAFALGGNAKPCVTSFDVDPTRPLAAAVSRVIAEFGGAPDDAALDEDAADVPRELQRELAQVVLGAAEAERTWRELTAGFSRTELAELGRVHGLFLRTQSGGPSWTDPRTRSLLATRFDEAALVRGAVTLALRVERAKLGRFAGLRGFDFEQETPLGRVVVRDAKNDVHEPGSHVLLLVDTGGDDTYRYAAGAVDATREGDSGHHVGLAIDLAGHDTYGYATKPDPNDGARLPADAAGRAPPSAAPDKGDGPISLSESARQGAARLGYGMLFDLGQDADDYRSLRLSQGFGAAGVGVLFDAGGDDRYEAESASQGAGYFGVGLLLDAGGNDVYRVYSQAQGFGAPRGVGLLYDRAGNDQFLSDNGDPADGGDPLYWTIQIPGKANNSFTQGAAWGVRDNDNPMSGGLGVLRDRDGDDVYVSSVQAQASGYWFGTGILADAAGNDRYDGRYYVQSAGAHFGLSLFVDDQGDDRYDTTFKPKATSIGVGHDRSVAWHLDLGGNDIYVAPPLSLGSGNANGIGILVNVGGDDVYRAAGDPSIGAANYSKEWYDWCASCAKLSTTGIFLDVGGRDTYDVPQSNVTRADDATWKNNRSPAEYGASEHGVGVDRGSGGVALP